MLIASHLAGLCQIRRAVGLRRSRRFRLTRPEARSGHRLLASAFGTRHLRAVEPVTSGAYGEGPVWRIGVTFGVSIVRAACSRGALLASGRHPRPRPSLDLRTLAGPSACHDSRRSPVLAGAQPVGANGTTGSHHRKGRPHATHDRSRPRRVRRVGELGPRHRPAAGRGPRRRRCRQPAARARVRRRLRQRSGPHDRRAGRARRALLRRRRDLERRRRRRRHRRARLRQRLRARARRELLPARGHVPGQHARRGDHSAGAAQRRNDRLLRRYGQLPRHVLRRRPRAAGRE